MFTKIAVLPSVDILGYLLAYDSGTGEDQETRVATFGMLKAAFALDPQFGNISLLKRISQVVGVKCHSAGKSLRDLRPANMAGWKMLDHSTEAHGSKEHPYTMDELRRFYDRFIDLRTRALTAVPLLTQERLAVLPPPLHVWFRQETIATLGYFYPCPVIEDESLEEYAKRFPRFSFEVKLGPFVKGIIGPTCREMFELAEDCKGIMMRH